MYDMVLNNVRLIDPSSGLDSDRLIAFNDGLIAAFAATFYPGVEKIGPHIITFESHDYFEVLRTIQFIT